MHFVGVVALPQSGDRRNVQDIEAAAAAGVGDKRSVLIVLVRHSGSRARS